MDRHERRLVAFLAGDLDESARREWDEHLLHCERCWQAVQEDRLGRAAAARLAEPAPPQLADRIRFAVEMSARPESSRRRPRPGRWALVGGGIFAVLVLAMVALPWASAPQPSDPDAVTTVVRRARALPEPASPSTSPARKAVPLRTPVTVMAGGAMLRLSYYRVGGVQAIVARADRPFSMPADAQESATGNMAWTASRGRVGLYCPRSKVLVAAPVPVDQLPDLAGHLPLR